LKPVHFNRSNTNAGEVLDAVVSSYGDYTWQFENGIVHVFKKMTVNDPRNPLNVVISKVPDYLLTENDADKFLFQSIVQVVRSTGPKVLQVPSGIGGEPQVHLAGENVPVREILNQIITASKLKIWIVTFLSDSSLTVKGFWEVTPMYDPKYFKPENQPFWIFLRWGDAPWKRLEH
jgi:hypothetical protein